MYAKFEVFIPLLCVFMRVFLKGFRALRIMGKCTVAIFYGTLNRAVFRDISELTQQGG